MCAGSELKDTQGETLSIEGADISELQAGRGRINDDHGKGFFNNLGKVTAAKKIFKAEDCENDRHKYYWEKIKAPYIYVAAELFNNEDHPNARAAAAILRNIHREDVPLKLKASVEGGVLARGISDPSRLAQTKIHSVALTFTPANTATLVEPVSLDKSTQDWEADRQLIKSVVHLAETNVPSFRHIERHASANTILENINKIKDLAKALGVEIQISESSPETIMKGAATYKIEQNIKKINELVKALDPKTGLVIKPSTLPDRQREARAAKEHEIRQTAADKYQRNIGALNIEKQSGGDIPTRATATLQPKIESVPLTTGEAFKQKQAEIKARTDAKIAAKQAAKQGGVQPVDTQSVEAKPVLAPAPTPVAPQSNAWPTSSNPRPKTIDDHAALAGQDPGYLDYLRSKLESQNANPDHVSQFINMIEQQSKVKKSEKYSKAKNNLIKALTAGFGGAGSPGDLSGGGVFQTESLESPKKSQGMQYVTCDNCGDEQVYMKHQVKCRRCHRNFNFDKLKDFI